MSGKLEFFGVKDEINDGYGLYTQNSDVIKLILDAPIEKMFAMYIRGDLNQLKKMIAKVFGNDIYLEKIFPRQR